MELWSCPGPEQWDRYLLDPVRTASAELERHLESCPFCRFLVAQRKRLFETLQQTWEESTGSRVIRLSGLELAEAGESRPELLAAQGGKETSLSDSLLLASADRTVGLVAVRDHHSGELWLYLRADDPALVGNVLVRPFGQEKEFLTDDEGRMNLGPTAWPTQTALTADVRLPKTVFTLSPLEGSSMAVTSTLLRSPQGDEIRVALTDTGSGRRLEIEPLRLAGISEELPLKVAIREGKREGILLIKSPGEKTLSVENIQASEPVEIFFFQ